jgi:HK97 family phage portal protein
MNLAQSLTFKALNALGLFKGINDNPFYQSYQFTGGFRFNDFNQIDVIDNGYAGNADLYSIVRKIVITSSAIPIDLFIVNPDGEKELVEDGELFDLMQQPNRLQTMTAFREEAMTYLLLNGNNYNVGYRAVGMGDAIREINVLPSNFVTIEGGTLAEPIKSYWYQEMKNLKFDPNDVMHVRYPNPKGEGIDRLYGLSPLEAGNNTLQSSNNTYDARGNIIKNHGISGILTNNSERSLRKEDSDELQDKWESMQTNAKKFGRTLITSAQLQFIQMGMSSKDLQLIENGVIDLRSLCNIYSVPSQLFNDVSGTTFNNMDAAKKSLYTESVLPNLDLWLKDFNNWFIASWAKAENKNYCAIANLKGIEVLQKDQKVEAEKDKIKMEGISSVLNMPSSSEAKSFLLQREYGYTEEEANIISQTNEDDRE